MNSQLPKVLHPLCGVPMIGHVLREVRRAGFDRRSVVLAPHMETVEDYCRQVDPSIECYVQDEQRGTADAVLAARSLLEGFAGNVVVLCADTPLLQANTLARVRDALGKGADVVVLCFKATNPRGYGRLIRNAERKLEAIREEKKASAEERAMTCCNSGVLGFRGDVLLELLDEIGCDNAKAEFYLTDAVEVARSKGLKVEAVVGDEAELLGINTRADLARAEALMCSSNG